MTQAIPATLADIQAPVRPRLDEVRSELRRIVAETPAPEREPFELGPYDSAAQQAVSVEVAHAFGVDVDVRDCAAHLEGEPYLSGVVGLLGGGRGRTQEQLGAGARQRQPRARRRAARH